MKGEYETIREAGAQVVAVSADDLEDGRRSHRAIFVIDRGGALLHQIPWFQPGNIGQFLEIFEVLGAV